MQGKVFLGTFKIHARCNGFGRFSFRRRR